MKRRGFMRAAGGVLVGAAVPSVASAETPDIRVRLWADESMNGHAQPLNSLAAFLQEQLEFIWPSATISVGPAGFHESESARSAEGALDNWQSNAPRGSVAECDLLVFSYEGAQWETNWGYADGRRFAVVRGGDFMDKSDILRNLALHEVLHTFGARHSWAEDGTIMNHIVSDGEPEYSDKTLRKLRYS